MKNYIFVFLFFTLSCFAQPGVEQNITIDIQTMFANTKQIFAKGNGTVRNKTIYLSDKKGLKIACIGTIGKENEEFYNFLYKKDTMRIKIIMPIYYKLQYIKIKKLNFKKGDFIIDFLKYITKTNKQKILGSFEVNNFPEDCIAYRKEDDVKK